MSSKETNINFHKYGLKTTLIKAWNVNGALVKPNDIIRNS